MTSSHPSSLVRACRGLKVLAALGLAASLLACGGGRQALPMSVHDFGPAPLAAASPAVNVEVRLSPWLDSTAVHYRLAYEDATRLGVYSQSRWAAPAGQLLGQRLRQQVGRGGGGCLLRLEVEEFAQVFDAPATSRGVLQGRMTLWDKQRKLLAERSFSAEKPAQSADARGGVAALIEAADASGKEAVLWLSGLERENRLPACR